mgnify:CR=1 FL=1
MCIPDEDEDFDEYKLTLTLVIENDQIKEIKDISGDGEEQFILYKSRVKRCCQSDITKEQYRRDRYGIVCNLFLKSNH